MKLAAALSFGLVLVSSASALPVSASEYARELDAREPSPTPPKPAPATVVKGGLPNRWPWQPWRPPPPPPVWWPWKPKPWPPPPPPGPWNRPPWRPWKRDESDDGDDLSNLIADLVSRAFDDDLEARTVIKPPPKPVIPAPKPKSFFPWPPAPIWPPRPVWPPRPTWPWRPQPPPWKPWNRPPWRPWKRDEGSEGSDGDELANLIDSALSTRDFEHIEARTPEDNAVDQAVNWVLDDLAKGESSIVARAFDDLEAREPFLGGLISAAIGAFAPQLIKPAVNLIKKVGPGVIKTVGGVIKKVIKKKLPIPGRYPLARDVSDDDVDELISNLFARGDDDASGDEALNQLVDLLRDA